MPRITIDNNGRILVADYGSGDIQVDTLPIGDITEYIYKSGKYFYDPLPLPVLPIPYVPTSEERIAALEDALAASLLGG